MENSRVVNLKETKENRKLLRNHSTSAESVLWTLLKNKQIDGLKFRRQQSFGPYIVDFYCPELNLAIELDGAVHDNPEAEKRDAERTNYLLSIAGITVFRFENKEVFCNQDLITDAIREFKAKSIK